jgi:hypothetical protein
VHYIVHVYARPHDGLKVIWKNHIKHHDKDGQIAFGVTSPPWDYGDTEALKLINPLFGHRPDKYHLPS